MDSIQDGDYVALVRRVLHIYHGTVQQPDGSYRAQRLYVDDEALLRHLRGEIAVAFCIGTRAQVDGRHLVRFVGIDIDKYAPRRLPIYREVLDELRIGGAFFVTGGSSEDKGKIIGTFAEMMPRSVAASLIEEIHDRAYRRAPSDLPEKPIPGNLELYPRSADTLKDAGLLRVLGRNVGRNGPLEIPLTFDGESSDLTMLRPLTRLQAQRIAALRKQTNHIPRWLRKLLGSPWSHATIGKSDAMFKKMVAMALWCLDTRGTEAQSTYLELLNVVLRNSPGLTASANDPRNPIQREIDSLAAWKAANGIGRRWKPLSFEKESPATRAYAALVEHVQKHGLRPEQFAVDSRTVAAIMGRSLSNAQVALDAAEVARYAVRFDYGEPRTHTDIGGKPGVNAGRAAVYGIVGEGESVYDLLVRYKGADRQAILIPYAAADLVVITATHDFVSEADAA